MTGNPTDDDALLRHIVVSATPRGVSESGNNDSAPEAVGSVPVRRRRRLVIAAGLSALLVVTIAAVVVIVRRPAHSGRTGVSQGRVVFTRGAPDGGLHVMSTDGTLTRITTDPGDWVPEWSPDGSEIVFNRFTNGNQNIYVMRADGSGIRRLTKDGSSSSPSWSPDGSRIVFARETPGNSDIYTMNADGTHMTRLTHDSLREGSPVWSPDGSQIAFVGDSGPSALHLFLMRSDGSHTRPIGPDNAAWPRWAPNGSKIAFVDEGNGSIHVINADGAGERQVVGVTSLPGGSGFGPNFTLPTWSPDGTKILFAAGNPTSSHLYIVVVAGARLGQLTTGSVTDETPAWSSTSP